MRTAPLLLSLPQQLAGYVPSADNRGASAVPGEEVERYRNGQRFGLRITS
jgi:hypothetical protein